MNQFYCNIANILKEDLLSHGDLLKYLSEIPVSGSFQFNPVGSRNLIETLKEINKKKSSGGYEIPVNVF